MARAVIGHARFDLLRASFNKYIRNTTTKICPQIFHFVRFKRRWLNQEIVYPAMIVFVLLQKKQEQAGIVLQQLKRNKMKKLLFAATTFLLSLASEAQWQIQNPGFTKDTVGFYEMSLPDKNTVWAVCYDGKNGLLSPNPVLSFTRTTDGGNTWTPGYVGTDKSLRFSNITAIDGQEAWVAMHKRDYSTLPTLQYVGFGKGGGIFHTTDGGVNWEHVFPGELFDANSTPEFIYFKDKNHGIAVGDPNQGYWEIYLTNNKGKKWKRVRTENIPAPVQNERGWISGYAAIGDTLWFGTTKGRMYKSIDFGKTWSVTTMTSLPSTEVNEIAFLDDGRTGVAHLRNNTIFRTYVFSTTDGGLTWTNYNQPANWKNSRVTAVPGTNAFVSTSTHNLAVFTGSSVSYDAGKTWAQIDQTAQKAVCRFYDATTGYAGGFHISGHPFFGNKGIFKSQIVFQTTLSKGNNLIAGIAKQPTIDELAITNETGLKVFPTPAKNMINVVIPDEFVNAETVLSMLTPDGKTVITRRPSAVKLLQVNVSHLPSGLYTIRLTSKNKILSRQVSIVK